MRRTATVVLPQPGGPVSSRFLQTWPMTDLPPLPEGSAGGPGLPKRLFDLPGRLLCPPPPQQLVEHLDGFLPRLAGVLEVALPEVLPPAGRLRFGADVFRGASGLPLDHQAAHVVGLLIDPPDLGGDLAHVLLRDHAVAGGLVELHRHADRVPLIPLDVQPVDLRERPLDLAVADDGLFNVTLPDLAADSVAGGGSGQENRPPRYGVFLLERHLDQEYQVEALPVPFTCRGLAPRARRPGLRQEVALPPAGQATPLAVL